MRRRATSARPSASAPARRSAGGRRSRRRPGPCRPVAGARSVKGAWAWALRLGGVWKETARVAVTARVAPVDPAPPMFEGTADGLALLAYPSFRFYDGRGASRAWLQEAPDTMTQAVWDPWVEIAAETAAKLGIARGDVVRVTSPHGAIELPADVSPTLRSEERR